MVDLQLGSDLLAKEHVFLAYYGVDEGHGIISLRTLRTLDGSSTMSSVEMDQRLLIPHAQSSSHCKSLLGDMLLSLVKEGSWVLEAE